MTSLFDSLNDAYRILGEFLGSPAQLKKVELMSQEISHLYRRGGNLFIAGNGGSHCDAMHFAEEFTGRFRKNRRPLGALALGDPSHVTCVANDFGFSEVFSRQLEGLGRKGDLFIGLSTSGNSENILLAVETAKKLGIRTLLLLGKNGGKAKGRADLEIIVPGNHSDRIQEMHMKIIHSVIEAVERDLFPENY